jgi:hypothetical protein
MALGTVFGMTRVLDVLEKEQRRYGLEHVTVCPTSHRVSAGF